MISANQIRQKYLDFFKKLNHKEIPSAPLLPENDPTTLFTSSGMQPLVPYLLGEIHPMGKRLVDSQKSFRSQDIMEVGDNRHTTFFEMLGNWSLGDYFKKEQLRYFFTFLTNEIGLDPHRFYVSVYAGNSEIGVPKDVESIEIWKTLFQEKNIKADVGDESIGIVGNARIFPYSDSKNWWSRSGEPKNMPIGEPGGPDSEVFFDFDPGSKKQIHEKSDFKKEKCHPNCDCGRFLEIGNSVFMQYRKTEKGFEELPQKNVDFGGGLERIVAAVNDTPDIFQTDLFLPIINFMVSPYKNISKEMRIIADHLRACVFLISDGVLPSNKLQGYFLRRLLRRAMLYAKKLGMEIQGKEMIKIALKVFDVYNNSPYSVDLHKNIDLITKIIVEEGDKFAKALNGKDIQKGIEEADKIFKKYDAEGGFLPMGEEAARIAFDLYQTYGMPIDLFFDVLEKRRLLLVYGFQDVQQLIEENFNKLKQEHQDLSRTASAGMFKGGLQDQSVEVTMLHTATHLLHKALHMVLGESVSQKGSNITSERLRFDFSWSEKMLNEQIKKVEEIVNEQIKKGAYAFFGEKYGEKVKVYTIGSFSKEVCGGPHVKNTKSLGKFSIMKEEAVGQGVRRIYAKLK